MRHDNPPETRPQERPRDIQQKAKTLTDDIGEFLELYYKLALVTATQKASNAASISITIIILVFLFMFLVLFGGLGLAWYLGQVLQSMVAGFILVACIFLIILTVTLAISKKVIFPHLRNFIIRKVYE